MHNAHEKHRTDESLGELMRPLPKIDKVRPLTKIQFSTSIPETWNYEKSVNKVKTLIFKWKNLTEELLTELWIAREKLSEQGGDRKSVQYQRNKSSIDKTWSNYCEEIGSSRQVVNRWLLNWENQKSEISTNYQKPETCGISDLNELVASRKRFKTIYADPPWKYSNQATRASTDNHYETMTVDEIASLPITQLSEEAAHLHLWTTNAFLHDAIHLIEKWGFDYKGVFIWVKPQMGIGNYWRVSHEFMLLGVRGNLRFADNSQKSWAEIERREHSEKPDEVRQIIEKVSQPRRLELFGRQLFKGWVVWGNEIERSLFNEQFFNKCR